MQMSATAIYQICKEVHELTYVEHGADNLVALVNKQYVFRFPRQEGAAKRLAFETALLQKIKGKITAVAVPELVQVHTRPLYVVAKYIEGDHLNGQEIQQLTEDEQLQVGRKLATFIHQFNQAVSGPEIRRLRAEAVVEGLAEPWPAYFERLFVHTRLPNDKLAPIIQHYYSLWKQYTAGEESLHPIHDDLHPSNLLFTASQLTGIVDFGDANVGSIESEMRWLYVMGDIVLKAAIEQYQELTGRVIDYDHIRVWAIMHELSSYVNWLAKQQTESFPFLRAQENLRHWVDNFPL